MDLNYPPVERKYGVEGPVAVEFNISDTGKVTDATIIQGVTPDVDAEVVRVVLSSPDWLPAREDNKWIPWKYTIRVDFKLQE